MALLLINNEIDDCNDNDNNINTCDKQINPLDIGIDITEQSIDQVYNSEDKDENKEQYYKARLFNKPKNPFFVDINGGNIKELKTNFFSTFPHVIILINNNMTQQEYDSFFKPTYDYQVDKFPNIGFIRVSTNILYNKKFKIIANIVEDNWLNHFFPFEMFNTQEIVISMIDIPKEIVMEITEQYNDLNKIFNIIYNYNHYGKSFDQNLLYKINHIKDCNYWINNSHCNINVTELFTLRDFHSKKQTSFTMICKPKNDTDEVANDECDSTVYPSRIKNKDKYCDIGVALKRGKKKFFPSMFNNKTITDTVTKIINLVNSEKALYYIVNNLLISKDYVHGIINNTDVLIKLAPLFSKYKGAFKYSFGYAWLTLYLEETMYTTRSNKHHRHVFDINTASNLPTFPFIMEDLKQNPYLPLLIDDKQIDINNNCLPISYIKNFSGYGVTDIKTFKRRLNIFVTENPELDIFTDINWNIFGLSGSIIPACLQKCSPLLDVIHQDLQVKEDKKDKRDCSDDAFKQFIKTYYETSDIDIMCNSKTLYEFFDEGYKLFNQIKHNLQLEDKECSIESIKSVGISVCKQFFVDSLDDFNEKNNLNWSLDDYIDNINDDRIKQYLYNIYVELKNKHNNQFVGIPTNVLRDEYYKVIPMDRISLYFVEYNMDNIKYFRDNDFTIYRNNILSAEKQVKNEENNLIMKIGENIRFKFNFSKIKRQIEYFQINANDFFNAVARFHLPCVRAYYQNNNVYMLPSCITAMMTGINIEYKYFAGIRNPVEIINKYTQRGYGIILNNEEIRQFKEYNTKLEESNIFKLNNTEDKQLSGLKTVNHKIFNKVDNTPTYKYVDNYEELKKLYNIDSSEKDIMFNPLGFKTINSNGLINKCIKSFFEMYLSLCSK